MKQTNPIIEDAMANALAARFPNADAELAARRDEAVAALRAKADASRNRKANAERFVFSFASTSPNTRESRNTSVLAKPAKRCAN